MNISDYIIETLYQNGIDTYFLLTGGAIAPFVNALDKNKNVSYYCFQHEQSASMAIEGYYRSCGKIGVVCVTSGPGVQNILNGVCGCWYDSVPAIFITGQVNVNEGLGALSCKPRQNGFQEMPVVEIFSSVTKKSLYAKNKESVPFIMEELLTTLFTPRYGPVLLDLPVNIQMETSKNNNIFIYKKYSEPTPKFNLDTHINNSKRPLIVFGNGVKLSKSVENAIRFAEDTNVPFLVTWGAIDICETDHPLRVGSPGVYGDRASNFAIQNADLLIIIGARLDSRQIGSNKKLFSTESIKIMVDIDENEINKFDNLIDYKIISDIQIFFNNLTYKHETNKFEEWIQTIKKWKLKFNDKNKSEVYTYLDKFFKTIPDRSIVVTDTGGSLAWTMQCANINKTHKLFSNFGNSSMGFALPCALGAAIGDKTRKVYCIAGDGGFQLNIQDILTIKKYELNIEIIILNNRGYGMIKQFQDGYFKSNYIATSFKDVFNYDIDFETIAKSYGVYTLSNVIIPEDQKICPKLEFGNSLENMSPYVECNELFVKFPLKKSVSGWVNV